MFNTADGGGCSVGIRAQYLGVGVAGSPPLARPLLPVLPEVALEALVPPGSVLQTQEPPPPPQGLLQPLAAVVHFH